MPDVIPSPHFRIDGPAGRRCPGLRWVVWALVLALAPFWRAGASPAVDVWRIESGPVDPANYFGETVANGMIGVVTSPVPFRSKQTLLNGVYDMFGPDRNNVMLNTFNVLDLDVGIDGTAIERLDQVRDFRQTLDLRKAALTTEFGYGSRATIRYTWYALRHLPNTALADVTITAHQPIALSVASSLRTPTPLVEAEKYVHQFKDVDTPPEPLVLLTTTASGPSGRFQVSATTAFRFDGWQGAPAVTRQVGADGKPAIGFTHAIGAGQSLHFTLVGTTLTSHHSQNPRNETGRRTVAAALQGGAELVARHERAWEALWAGHIAIDGDDRLQRDVNAMLYHLYAFSREGTAYSLSPMGLSGTGYNGHVFWDAETWMFPVFLALQPEMARSMLMYRFERLPAARRNAVGNGYRGAMFPWESAESGDEETPLCCLTGPFEHHITADVGIAAWQYYQVTQDIDWLREYGWPLLRDTAAFWASRVERNGPGRYDIRGVVPADEDAGVVDNNAFTNAAAKANLAAAISAAKILGRTPDPDWQQVRDNIPILRFADGTIREHATYDGQIIKQADVNLLAYPLSEVRDPVAIRRDLDYYAPKVRHDGPTMTRSIFGILRARLGMPDEALKDFQHGYRTNQRPPFGVLAESATNDEVYFATGAGGLLQTLLYGFSGLHVTDQGLVHRPGRLPQGWKSLTLSGVGPRRQVFVTESDK